MNIHKENPFDWFKALEEQRKLSLELEAFYALPPNQDVEINMDMGIKDQIYKKEKRNLNILAGGWVTCACGNLCDAIPRLDDQLHEPADQILSTIGVLFSKAIGNSDWKLAIKYLHEIEARAVELLEEINR